MHDTLYKLSTVSPVSKGRELPSLVESAGNNYIITLIIILLNPALLKIPHATLQIT